MHDEVAVAAVALIEQFNKAFNDQDLEAVMALMSDDCLFENTTPLPDGAQHKGKAAVQAAFEAFFQSSPQAHFDIEEVFVAGDRCVARWVYHWRSADGQPGHVRGVDLFRLRDGKIVEKRSYVKG
jgi:steroid delta-isomerase-like uncharacterized protein